MREERWESEEHPGGERGVSKSPVTGARSYQRSAEMKPEEKMSRLYCRQNRPWGLLKFQAEMGQFFCLLRTLERKVLYRPTTISRSLGKNKFYSAKQAGLPSCPSSGHIVRWFWLYAVGVGV